MDDGTREARSDSITQRSLYYLSVFSGVLSVWDPRPQLREISYYIRHVCPSLCPYGTTRLQMHGFSLI